MGLNGNWLAAGGLFSSKTFPNIGKTAPSDDIYLFDVSNGLGPPETDAKQPTFKQSVKGEHTGAPMGLSCACTHRPAREPLPPATPHLHPTPRTM